MLSHEFSLWLAWQRGVLHGRQAQAFWRAKMEKLCVNSEDIQHVMGCVAAGEWMRCRLKCDKCRVTANQAARHAPSTSAARRYRSACISVFHAPPSLEGSSGSYDLIFRVKAMPTLIRAFYAYSKKSLRFDIRQVWRCIW